MPWKYPKRKVYDWDSLQTTDPKPQKTFFNPSRINVKITIPGHIMLIMHTAITYSEDFHIYKLKVVHRSMCIHQQLTSIPNSRPTYLTFHKHLKYYMLRRANLLTL